MPHVDATYDRNAAVLYAHRWAHGRNPRYYNFDKLGGDCTNFVSQCLFAGARVMSFDPKNAWFYRSGNHKTPSWSGVPYLRNFLVQNSGHGPRALETTAQNILPGDVLQLCFDGNVFHHSLFVVGVGPTPESATIFVAAHTDDADNRPLSTYTYQKCRYLHILSVGQ